MVLDNIALRTEEVDYLTRLITKYGLEQYADGIFSVAQPAVRLSLETIQDDEVPIGGSRFSGSPDMDPEDITDGIFVLQIAPTMCLQLIPA